MKNCTMYCIAIDNNLFGKIKHLDLIPVGLGNDNFSKEWIRDNSGENISYKNKFFGEYTFHYWLWKNFMKELPNNKWVGFCGYRRFWSKNKKINQKKFDLKDNILNEIPKEWEKYDVILGDEIKLDSIKWIKIIKYGKLALLNNPKAIFKNGRNIKFHFDMFHGNGILEKAINLLNKTDKDNFRKFINNQNSYNQGNMFICKSKKIMENYYRTVFEWLKKCEKIFGYDLKGYGKVRIYAFLAERFMSYWFKKNTNYIECPIIFYNLKDEN